MIYYPFSLKQNTLAYLFDIASYQMNSVQQHEFYQLSKQYEDYKCIIQIKYTIKNIRCI